MSASSKVRRGPGERLRAWVVTGPVGHLLSVLGDVAAFGARWLWAVVRGKPGPLG